MPDRQLANLLLEQSNDLIWIIDSRFCLKYANQAYQNVMKQVTGEEKKMDEPIFIEGFGDGYIEKWKAYYERGLKGEHFEIDEHFYNPHTNQVEYSQISFKPLTNENQVVVNVACQSRDITSFIKSNTEAEILLDASLDVICSIDEQGNFTKVSAACKELWGYEKQELIGKAYISFVIGEDIEKTNLVAADIIAGKAFTTFENRYKRKDGGIAFNLWSARWDPKTQLMFCVARDAREKLKKEELLIESENRFRALVQEGSDLVAILDEAGIYTYVSPTSIGILGMEPEEFIGKNPFDFIHPEDAEKTLNSLSKITSESRVEVEPFRFQNKNGEWRWIETVLTNMMNNPAVNGIVANSRDITQRKKADVEIAKSEEKRRLIMNGALDAIISIDTNETITFWNPQAEVIFGWKAEEVMGKPLSEIIIPEPFRKYHVEGIKNYLKTGEGKALNVLLELSAIRRNREEFPIELTVIPIKQGGEEFFCAFIRDITKRKKSEAARIMAEKNYQELFDKSNDAIYIHDIDTGQLIDVNYRATELTGFDKVDILEKAPSILFTDNPEYSIEKAIENIQKAAQGEPQVFDWLAKKKDGTSSWFEMTLKRTSIAGVDKILAFQRDISERKKSEKELLELNNILKTKLAELETAYDELEQFAYIASHDLQEPLRMISSFMDQLKRKYGEQLDGKAHQYIEFAIDGAKRMKQIILDLLEYSRAGKIQEEPQQVDINRILNEYKILRRKVITEKQVVIETEKLPSIITYSTPLVQVVHNLIDNAIKYSKNDENPVVKITCIDQNKFWEFCVEDNGIGIDEKFFSKIFVIFQRLHDRDNFSGTGIGLSIVKKQVESLGGKIWIESKVNVGSKFYFTIPK